MLDPVISWAIANSDPANLALLSIVWWRLDRRLRRLSERQEELHGSEPSSEN
jgi:hypothetical protein